MLFILSNICNLRQHSPLLNSSIAHFNKLSLESTIRDLFRQSHTNLSPEQSSHSVRNPTTPH